MANQQVPREQLPAQLTDKMGPDPQQAMHKLPGPIQQAILAPPPPPQYQQLQQVAQLDEGAKKALLDQMTTNLRRMRFFRRQYDQKRLEWYRQYLGQRDQQMFPDNVTRRSNSFFPYPFNNVETITTRTVDAFFSFMPWFDCKGRNAASEGAAELMGKVLDVKLHSSAIEDAVECLVRNIGIYGHAGIKVDWDWGFDIVTYAAPIPAMDALGQPILNPMTGQPVIIGYKPAQKQVPRNRPKFIPIDIFDLLIDPDGNIIAHMTEKSLGDMLREASANPKLYYPEALQELADRLRLEKDPEKVIVRVAEVWDNVNNTQTLLTFGEDSDIITLKDYRFALRTGTAYSSFKRRAYGGPSILLFHGDNPFIHRRCPILHTSYVKVPNEVYGIGAIEVISDLTESLNRMVNMITDNWNMGINRRYAYDTQADIDQDALNNANVPGGKVAVTGDPSKVLMPLPFFTPQAGDYALLETYKGMIQLAAGMDDFYAKGIGTPTNNRTATGINQMVQESNYRFRIFIRNIELDILQPLLEMSAMMIQQYITGPEEMLITKEPEGIPKFYQVQPEELIGSFDFNIVAANYAENKQIRQRNLLAFAQLAAQSPFLNQYEGLKELAKVFEVRNINRILKTPQQVATEQAQAMQQEMKMMIFQAMLEAETKSKIAAAKPGPGQGAGGGRPRTSGSPGRTPGAGLDSAIREFAQQLGSNALHAGD